MQRVLLHVEYVSDKLQPFHCSTNRLKHEQNKLMNGYNYKTMNRLLSKEVIWLCRLSIIKNYKIIHTKKCMHLIKYTSSNQRLEQRAYGRIC